MKNQILLLVVLVFANFNDLVAEDGEAIGAKNQNRRVNSNRQRQPRLDNAAGPTAVPVTEVNLIDSVQCRYDVLHLCPSETHNNNFAVLECFQRDSSTYGQLQPRCQRYIWMYKRNLTVDFRFENAARAICNKEVNRTGCSSSIGKKGHLVNCLIENFRTVSFNFTLQCVKDQNTAHKFLISSNSGGNCGNFAQVFLDSNLYCA